MIIPLWSCKSSLLGYECYRTLFCPDPLRSFLYSVFIPAPASVCFCYYVPLPETLHYWHWFSCSTETLKSLGVYSFLRRALSMTSLHRSVNDHLLCYEFGSALELDINSRAQWDQAIADPCGTLPEIIPLFDFLLFPSVFLLLLYWFLPREFL